MQKGSLQIVGGGRVTADVVLTPTIIESLYTRFMYHSAKLSTLAWELGCSQGKICEALIAHERERTYRKGVRDGRSMLWQQQGQVA